MRNELWEKRAETIGQYSGLSLSEASKASGFTRATLLSYSKRFGFDFGVSVEREELGDDPRVGQIIEAAETGFTRQQTADRLGISLNIVSRIAREHSITFAHPMDTPFDRDRADAMAAMYRGGKTLAEIGELFSVTRERVRQIIKKRHGMTAADGGQRVVASRNESARKAVKERRYQKKYGCSVEEYIRIHELARQLRPEITQPVTCFNSQRMNARRRSIAWTMTFSEWWSVWEASGKWALRGRRRDEYVMCRFGDQGEYSIGNVYIAPALHNVTFQPNNPYRKSHPRHEEVMVDVRRKLSSRERKSSRTKHFDLPLGVTISNNRYMAQICICGRNRYLGSFKNPEDASAAYQAKLAEITSIQREGDAA